MVSNFHASILKNMWSDFLSEAGDDEMWSNTFQTLCLVTLFQKGAEQEQEMGLGLNKTPVVSHQLSVSQNLLPGESVDLHTPGTFVCC